MKMLITGSDGFIGMHSCLYFKNEGYEILKINKEQFNNSEILKTKVAKADIIVHTAGLNRSNEDGVVYDTNIEITYKLVEALADTKDKIVFNCSSIQREYDNEYGRAKLESETLLNLPEVTLYNLILPNVFGEGCRPNHNNFIATFCYNFANNIPVNVKLDKLVDNIYIGEVMEVIKNKIIKDSVKDVVDNAYEKTNLVKFESHKFYVSSVKEMIEEFKNMDKNVAPNYVGIAKYLYKTYLYYVLKNDLVNTPYKNIDERGELAELIKSNLNSHVFISNSKPGIVRGKHYHTRKMERFIMLEGISKVSFKNIFTGVIEEVMIGPGWTTIDIPCFHSHKLENTTNNQTTALFWCDEIYNPDDKDTYYHEF